MADDDLDGVQDEVDLRAKLDEIIAKNPHLGEYIEDYMTETGLEPTFVDVLARDMSKMAKPDLIYPAGDPIFIHVHKKAEGTMAYHVIQPTLFGEEEKQYEQIMDNLIRVAYTEAPPLDREALVSALKRMLNQVVYISVIDNPVLKNLIRMALSKIVVTPSTYAKIEYILIRDLVDEGPLYPIVSDSYIEDIHCVGLGNMFLNHKVFGLMEASVEFLSDVVLNEFIFRMSERVGKPVSDANPIVDAALPDGSRVNFIYSREISKRGSSFTIRKFSPKPYSVTQLIEWKSFSPEIAAYLWLLLENGMSIFVCGETASGKTTTLKAMTTFIRPDSKIFTVEDTPEVVVPHYCWQQLITRDSGAAGSRVEMFDLLRAALRSRPNYIIAGEIRGAEGAVAFQAMQTGHPVLSTFHAASVHQMVQRMTGNPINVPATFMDNLNAVLIQRAFYRDGRLIRRVTSVDEIEGYYEETGNVISRTVFKWDSAYDTQEFVGMFNSYLLEEKVAQKMGLKDPRTIYNELDRRARIIAEMQRRKILDYEEVYEIVKVYLNFGVEGLPFVI